VIEPLRLADARDCAKVIRSRYTVAGVVHRAPRQRCGYQYSRRLGGLVGAVGLRLGLDLSHLVDVVRDLASSWCTANSSTSALRHSVDVSRVGARAAPGAGRAIRP